MDLLLSFLVRLSLYSPPPPPTRGYSELLAVENCVKKCKNVRGMKHECWLQREKKRERETMSLGLWPALVGHCASEAHKIRSRQTPSEGRSSVVSQLTWYKGKNAKHLPLTSHAAFVTAGKHSIHAALICVAVDPTWQRAYKERRRERLRAERGQFNHLDGVQSNVEMNKASTASGPSLDLHMRTFVCLNGPNIDAESWKVCFPAHNTQHLQY